MRRKGARTRAAGARGAARVRALPAASRLATAGRAGAAPQAPERLQKLLARTGLASRREAEGWIRAGRLTINGVVAALGARVLPRDKVHLDGRLVHTRVADSGPRAFLCHRSPGEPLATPAADASAPTPRPALLERLPRRAGRRFIAVSPMPRVDGGLELVTADGELAARLQRGAHTLMSEFGVRVRGELNDTQLQGILGGALDSGARLEVERCEAAGGEGANRWYRLAARGASGKQVRQLFERCGALVSRVLRTQLGPVRLERALGRGQFRELSAEELRALVAPVETPAQGL
jgi:23S rRNA pseudouridine2605 synthase